MVHRNRKNFLFLWKFFHGVRGRTAIDKLQCAHIQTLRTSSSVLEVWIAGEY